MGVCQQGKYQGGLRVEMRHEPSGATVTTAAPVDNGGDGSLFSPTDLVGTALASCIVTTIALVAERKGIATPKLSVTVEKEMQSSPRRIARLPVVVTMTGSLSEEQRQILERAARSCPVHASLHPEIDAPITFVYE